MFYMKTFKYILITTLCFLGLSGAVFVTSCEVDPCSELSCKNGGNCINGLCSCPAGYEGAECEFKSADRFLGKYAGLSRCGIYPAVEDTATIVLISYPDQVEVQIGLGNTSILKSQGTARTPYIIFPVYEDGGVKVTTTAVIDNKQLTFYKETLNKTTGGRDVCEFIGIRVDTAQGG